MNRGWTRRWRKRWDKGYHQDAELWVLMDYFIDYANYKDSDVYIPNEGMITVKRGQRVFGTNKLAAFFGWDRGKIRRKLDILVEIGFMTIRTTNRYSIGTIINYNIYQPADGQNDQQNGQQNDQQNDQQNGQQNDHQTTSRTASRTTTNKEDKNNKKDKEKKKKESGLNPQQIIDQVIDHLNRKAGVKFKPDLYATQTLLIDRINEGFVLDDFKAVINKKCSQWLNDARMVGNLRPATLFASDKFEGYLQEARRNGSGPKAKAVNKLSDIELLALGCDVLSKFGEDKFKEFCSMNNLPPNDVESIRMRATHRPP